MDQITPTLRFWQKTYLIVSNIINILSYKYRHLAQCLLYMESFQLLIHQMYPSKEYLEITTRMMVMSQFIIVVSYYCNSGSQIICTTIGFVLRVMLPVLQSTE